jgi:hypothetical protein
MASPPVSSGLAAWYDASQLAGDAYYPTLTDGQALPYWPDISVGGNILHAAYGDASYNDPGYFASGLPTVQFTGSGPLVNLAFGSGDAGNFYVFLVAQSAAGGEAWIWLQPLVEATGLLAGYGSGDWLLYEYGEEYPSGGNSQDELPHIFSCGCVNGALASFLRVDGTEFDGDMSPEPSSYFYVGGSIAGGAASSPMIGYIGEVLVYQDVTLTSDQIEATEAYLNDKWFGSGPPPPTGSAPGFFVRI